MRLTQVRVQRFRNIIDSEPVPIQPDVTCLVGKNESGKTAFLHCLYRLRPDRSNVEFSVPTQYPAWLEKKHRHQGQDLEQFRPARAEFLVEDDDRVAVEESFGSGVLKSGSVVFERAYNGHGSYIISCSEHHFVTHVLDSVDLPHGTKTRAKTVKSIEQLREFAGTLTDAEGESAEERQEVARRISGVLDSTVGEKSLSEAVWQKVLGHRVPKFLYFANYSMLPYSVDIKDVLNTDPSDLDDPEITARALLQLAAADDDYLVNPDYERRKRELENVANAITDDVLNYWTQNPSLRVLLDITQRTETTPQGQQAVIDELKIRVWDERHQLSLPFDEHSSGFRWFFSFLAAFSEYEHTTEPVVILLDEPALGLHAKAQADFLRFIDERLAPRCQVIYTTHSPFMIQPGNLDRVRVVEDKGRDIGATVSTDVTTTDPDTLFPLQGALGYDLVQHLFIAPHNLVVEGPCDFTYLIVLSDHLKSIGGHTVLDDRWSIVPVGGADLVPTFVALLGHHLDVTVLLDARKSGHQRLSTMADSGILERNRILTIGQVFKLQAADIEDVFTADDYLALYNRAFGTSWSTEDLDGNGPIVSQLARKEGIDRFDHGKPADELLRHRDEILPGLGDDTLDRFDSLFQAVNKTLPPN